MAEDLELIRNRETIELQHDRRIQRCHVAMPNIVRDTGKKNVRVAALECLWHRQVRNRMTLTEILAQKKRVDPRCVPANDHILIVIRENLRLNKVTRAEQLGYSARFANRA